MAEDSVMTEQPRKFDHLRGQYPHLSAKACSKCKGHDVRYRVVESFCGGHEDYNYFCFDCGHNGWIDGIDS